jgi:glutathione synthase
MRIGFVVNDPDTEMERAATTVMMHAAGTLGHDVRVIGVGDLTYQTDGRVAAIARTGPPGGTDTQRDFLKAIQGRDAPRERIFCDDLDVLYLRYNPIEDEVGRPWERDAGTAFGRLAMLCGTLVLNDPYALAFGVNKTYLEHFPAEIRPKCVITRSSKEVLRFYEEQGGNIVIKPIDGYGGKDVYLIREDPINLNQIVESIARTSYVVAQEFLPAAMEGDIRLFLVNGRALEADGKYAAVHRVNKAGDFRSNMTAGAKPQPAEITPEILRIVDVVRPRLLADGMFEVGIDIVGDKLVEINTISAGGMNVAGKMQGVNFGLEVIRAIERKVEYRREHGSEISNRELAVME